METTVGIVTALNPILGYEKSTELAQEATRAEGNPGESLGKEGTDRGADSRSC